jgi:hypothetical protein
MEIMKTIEKITDDGDIQIFEKYSRKDLRSLIKWSFEEYEWSIENGSNF